MRYEEFSEEELAELRRPRPGTQEEMETRILKVKGFRDQEVARLLASGDGPKRRSLLEATEMAAGKVYIRILTRWERSGELKPWEATWQYFKRVQTTCEIDYLRGQGPVIPKDPTVLTATSDGTQGIRTYAPGHAGEGSDIAQVMHTVPGADADRPVLFSAVARRAVRVLRRRTHKPLFEGRRATVAEYYDALVLGRAELEAAGSDHPMAFVNRDTWRADLATAFVVPRDRIDEDVVAILGEVKKCFYLFVLLASPRHAVVQPEAMNRLLDVSHLAGHGLAATSRMLLQKAGVQLARVERRWTIAVERFLREARKLGRMQGKSDDDIVGSLHDSEAEYSLKAPKQTNPPQFRCILRCAEHSPAKEG